MLPVTLFLWRYLPELRFVQFPWRWMSILAVCAMVFTASSARGWQRWAWPIVATIAIAAAGQYLVKNAWWDTEDMPTLQAAMKDGTGFEGTDEYDPVGDDHTDLLQKEPRAKFIAAPGELEAQKQARVTIEKWTAEDRKLRIVTRAPGHMVLRLLSYPAWRVTLNGRPISLQHGKGTEQMIVPVPAGDSELHIDFTRTSDRTAGGWISIASLAAATCILICQRREPLAAKAQRRSAAG
jgi:hypothetical protein